MKQNSISGTEIVDGAVFDLHRGPVHEQVKVLAVAEDAFGIPHVRYWLELSRAGNHDPVGQRTLALRSFRARYASA